MLTLLWLSEGKRPATFRHIVVYIARCLFLGLSWSSFFACFFFSICVVSYFSQDILTLLLVLGLWSLGARKPVSQVLVLGLWSLGARKPVSQVQLGAISMCRGWVIGCDESASELEVRSLNCSSCLQVWVVWSGNNLPIIRGTLHQGTQSFPCSHATWLGAMVVIWILQSLIAHVIVGWNVLHLSTVLFRIVVSGTSNLSKSWVLNCFMMFLW